MTDYKQLCSELVNDLELCDWPSKLKEAFRDDIQRARITLAEPKTAGPTDEELLQVFDTACLSEGGMVDEIHLRGLRAVLARWGNHPVSPDSLAQSS